MKIENQVCTLQQAKKLNELGIIQDGYFVYRHWRGNGNIILSRRLDKYNDYPKHMRQVAPSVLGCAFTVAELSVMLDDLEGLVTYDKESGKWFGEYHDPLLPTEAEAKAALLIKFLESEDNYINPTVCNTRLTA
jgi:hypothetical protein